MNSTKTAARKPIGKPIAIICVLFLLTGSAYMLMKGKKAKEAETDVVSMYQTQMARQDSVYVTVSGSGVIEANARAEIKPKISGDIVKIYKKEGDFVKAGEVIALLDGSDYELRYRQAQADLNSAKVKLEQAKKDASLYPTQARSSVEQAKASFLSAQQNLNQLLEGPKPQDIEQQKSAVRQQKASYDNANADHLRLKDLFGQGAISKQQLDEAQVKSVTTYEQYVSAKQKLDSLQEKASKDEIDAVRAQYKQAEANLKLAESNSSTNLKLDALAQAQTQYESARANLETARKNLEYVKIKSPISGTLWSLSAVVGDSVSGAQGFTSIANVIDSDSLHVRVSIDESDIHQVQVGQRAKVTTDALEDATFMGKVAKIAPEATVTDGVSTYDVVIDLDPGTQGIKPGMNADADILIDFAENVLTVPVSAVMDRDGRKTIIVLDGKEPSYRRVVIGKISDTLAEVQSGVSQGEAVVINPNVGNVSSGSGQQQGGSGGMGFGMGGFMGGGFRR